MKSIILDYCYVITDNQLKADRLKNWFNSVGLPEPNIFYSTDSAGKSHYDLIKYAQKNNLPHITVLEDTAVPSQNIIEKIEKLNEVLAKHINDIGIIQLGTGLKGGWGEIIPKNIETAYDIFYRNTHTWGGSWAIFINKNSYEDRLNSLRHKTKILGYDYFKTDGLDYNYADRFTQEFFKKDCLVVKDNIFEKNDAIGNNDIALRRGGSDLSQTITIPCNELLKYSFVLSINKDQYDLFSHIFLSNELFPLPSLYDGIKIKKIYSWTYGKYELLEEPLIKVANCSYSHVSMVKMAKCLDWPYVCVFEDDAYPCHDILNKLTSYLTNIPSDVSLLVLGSIAFIAGEPHHNDKRYVRIAKNYGSHAYILFKSAYDAYLANAYTNNATADLLFETMPGCYRTKENLFVQARITENSISNIDGKIYPDKIDDTPTEKLFPALFGYMQNQSFQICCAGRLGNLLFEIANKISAAKKPVTNILIIPEYDFDLDYYSTHIPKIAKLLLNNVKLFIMPKPKLKFSQAEIKFNGYAQSESCFNQDITRKIIKLDPGYAADIMAKFKNIKFNDSVGMHIRRTDYVSLDYYYHLPPAAYYINAYKKFFNGKQVIICSDDIEWCKKNIKIKDCIFIHEDELTDFYVLALCEHHICSNSTFSWWAAWINEKKNSINVFPKYWFNQKHNKDLGEKEIENHVVPNRWLKFNEY